MTPWAPPLLLGAAALCGGPAAPPTAAPPSRTCARWSPRSQPLPPAAAVPRARWRRRAAPFRLAASSAGSEDGDGGEDEDENEDEDEDKAEVETDWRDFRARLIMQHQRESPEGERGGDGEGADSDGGGGVGGGWAYDSGDAVERGSVVLSRPEQDFGYGLRQQYFHKCAILVLEHDAGFTRGIILNRPTDLVLSDDDFVYDDGTPLEDVDESNRWRVWFGGDVGGIYSDEPVVTCLHSLGSDLAKEVSDEVMRDVRWTTMVGARRLLREGDADPDDFWVFCGYAGWTAGQLADELRRESWYMAATDSQTLLMELKRQGRGDADPRDAGVGTWEMLMGRIGRGDEAADAGGGGGGEGSFDDLMLREWARERLVFSEWAGGSAADGEGSRGLSEGPGEGSGAVGATSAELDEIDSMILRASRAAAAAGAGPSLGGALRPGALVRASASPRSPFLLDDQEFHKSIILILQDDQAVSVGVLLNLPSAHGFELKGPGGWSWTLTQRYGGRFGIKGESDKPFVWLHSSDALRDAGVGSPVGGRDENVWMCTKQEDASAALSAGLASPDDFIVVNGFSVWEKEGGGGTAGGILEEVLSGRFEVVPADRVPRVWELLRGQGLLTEETMGRSLDLIDEAWAAAAASEEHGIGTSKGDDGSDGASVRTPSDGSDLVYKSRTSVRELADAALRSWIVTFLLGVPEIRGT